MTTHHLTVPRTARYVTLGASGADVREVWYVLHGYGQLAKDFIRPFAALDDGTRLIVAPEALSRYYVKSGLGQVGATWMTKADREAEIADYVRYLDVLDKRLFETLDRAAVRRVVLGFSQGTATASRWAALGHAAPDRLICWAGAVAHDLDLAAHRDRLDGLTLVLGTEDEYISEERANQETARLKSAGLSIETHTFDGTHRLHTDTLKRIAAAF